MQIRLTVLGPRGGRTRLSPPGRCDVIVTAPEGTSLGTVAGALAAAAGSAQPGGRSSGASLALYAGTQRLSPDAVLGAPPLVDGALLSLHAPAEQHADRFGRFGQYGQYGRPPAELPRLHVVGGPDAGGVHLLQGGQARIGRSADADVPLDDPDVSRLHCEVAVGPDGQVTVADLGSTNGSLLGLRPLGERPQAFAQGALLQIGESTLRLEGARGAGPAPLASVPDGAGHLRVSLVESDLPAPAGGGAAGPSADLRGAGGVAGAEYAAGGGTAGRPSGYGAAGGAGERSAGYAAQWGAPGGDGSQAGRRGEDGGHGGAAAGRATTAGEVDRRPGIRTTSPDADTADTADTADAARGGVTHGAGMRLDGGIPEAFPAGFPAEPQREVRGRRATGERSRGERPGEAAAGRGRGMSAISAWARRRLGASARADVPEPEDGGGEAEALRERWPDPAAVLLTALGPGRRLWERTPGHPDALTVRLGTAELPSEDGLRRLPAVPFTVDLRVPVTSALTLAGPRPRLAGLARAVLAQLCALHSPTALEVVLLSADRTRAADERAEEWSWLNWLPHLRPAHGQDCRLLLAHDREQAQARTAELARRIESGPLGAAWASAPQHAVTAAAAAYDGPFCVLVVDGDPGSAALRETVERIAAAGPSAGVHVLCLAAAGERAAITHGLVARLSGDVATTLRVETAGGVSEPGAGGAATGAGAAAGGPAAGSAGRDVPVYGTGSAYLGGPSGSGRAGAPDIAHAPSVLPALPVPDEIVLDAVSADWAEHFARALAPLREADGGPAPSRNAPPATVRLLDELDLALATPAKIAARWADAPVPAAGGRAVLGASAGGRVEIDLVAEGPHLLVGGAAGAGKTELLRSAAAALAAGERPERLALLLIDGAGAERGEGLATCAELPHVTGHLVASDPIRMREFAQRLAAELKRRVEVLDGKPFGAWHAERLVTASVPRQSRRGSAGTASGGVSGVAEGFGTGGTGEAAELPRLVVLVDDFDELVAPGLGSPGRPAAGSVVRALEAVARDGERLGVHLIAATGRPERTAGTDTDEQARLRVALRMPDPESAALLVTVEDAAALDDGTPGRGYLRRPGGGVTLFQTARVSARIPRTATLRPTVVPLEWERMGDPPARRHVRELGNGPTDLALLASALQRAATTTPQSTHP